MVYSIHKGGRGRGVYCAVVVQHYCNSVGITGGGSINDYWLVRKSVEVNEYLVKATSIPLPYDSYTTPTPYPPYYPY